MSSRRVSIPTSDTWRWRALAWAVAQQADDAGFVAFLANNGIQYPNNPFPNRLFVGAKRVVSFSGNDLFRDLHEAHQQRPSYLVGYIAYDVKNQLEQLSSRNPDRLGFPEVYFVEPAWVIEFEDGAVRIHGEGDVEAVLEAIHHTEPITTPPVLKPQSVQCRVSPEAYQAAVQRIQAHIREGDVYELNYCIEFFVEQTQIDPLATYYALTERSPMPFSAFLKVGDRYVLGASPERFLKKEADRLIAQPIKGTARRGLTPAEDQQLREQLFRSEKERAENLMIVDLMRNDLARSAKTGTVQVDELFGIYGFRQVYQMISTVSATLRSGVTWADSIRNAFPMGSMTGAPKIRAMELIDELEVSRRGLYSGTIGYVTPAGDFDFNVVIRSLLYNAESRYASFSVGSAITYDADPAQEWEECLLKARAIRNVLENKV
ncbi:anthranilate synthase component I family protein [Spirosoma knui]